MSNSAPASLREKAELAIAASETNTGIVRAFLGRYPADGIPANVFTVDLAGSKPRISVHMFVAPDAAGKDKLLGYVGQAWGTAGWTRSDTFSRRNAFDWKKELDGIELTIYEAETLEPISAPVPPSKFPLLLAESSEEGGAEA